MKNSKVVLTALVLSAIFSAIATELSMRYSTNQAVSAMQDIELTGESLANIDVQYESMDDNLNNQSESEKISQDDLKESIEQIQQLPSIYSYPGYWSFWFQVFLKTFITTFLVALLQSFMVIKAMKKDTSTPK